MVSLTSSGIAKRWCSFALSYDNGIGHQVPVVLLTQRLKLWEEREYAVFVEDNILTNIHQRPSVQKESEEQSGGCSVGSYCRARLERPSGISQDESRVVCWLPLTLTQKVEDLWLRS